MQIAHHRLVPGEYACFTLPESPVVETGHRLINTSGCRRCHQTAHKGNVLASDLDGVLLKVQPENLANAIKYPVTFMPDFYFQELDVTRLVNAILDSSAVYASKSGALSQIIHFEEDKEDSDNVFSRNCGACHRILTQRLGGIGRGDIGPNLSGIFSDFYFYNIQPGANRSALEPALPEYRFSLCGVFGIYPDLDTVPRSQAAGKSLGDEMDNFGIAAAACSVVCGQINRACL